MLNVAIKTLEVFYTDPKEFRNLVQRLFHYYFTKNNFLFKLRSFVLYKLPKLGTVVYCIHLVKISKATLKFHQ